MEDYEKLQCNKTLTQIKIKEKFTRVVRKILGKTSEESYANLECKEIINDIIPNLDPTNYNNSKNLLGQCTDKNSKEIDHYIQCVGLSQKIKQKKEQEERVAKEKERSAIENAKNDTAKKTKLPLLKRLNGASASFRNSQKKSKRKSKRKSQKKSKRKSKRKSQKKSK